MKLSRYNYYHNAEGTYLIYNVLAGTYVVLTIETMNLLNTCIENICSLKDKHIELYNTLISNGMLVDKDLDETYHCVEVLRSRFQNNGVLSLTINPTLNCNVNCWYCYENHKASKMSPEIILSIQRLIQNKVKSENISKIHLGFFGGEPLLHFDDCVLPIIEFAYDYSQKRNLDLSISFTTNAILMNTKLIDKLVSFGVPINIQVPFDGNETFHNKVKISKVNTYQHTLLNVKYAISKGVDTIVRCNYTNQSVNSFSELIVDLQDDIKLYPDKINFSFQKIWQIKETPETILSVEKLERMVHDSKGTFYDSSLDISSCYADYNNSFVINYNGDVYQCTARDFTDDTKEGVLNLNGTITYNERYHNRMKSLYDNEICKQCLVWPICNACSQKRLEKHNNQCVLNLTEVERYSKIKGIVNRIIKNL